VSRPLLDVNFLVALHSPDHIFHDLARHWFHANHKHGWASCALTQSGYVRISTQTVGGGMAVIAKHIEALRHMCSAHEHEFWPLDFQFSEIPDLIRSRLQGPGQISDAVLLALALRRGGRLVTFDKRIRNLLPPDSPHQAAIEVIEPRTA
jgi:uncharacterized protein